MEDVGVRFALVFLVAALLPGAWSGTGRAQDGKERSYVGSAACESCHEKEYKSFEQNSKKARSYSSVLLMKKGLTKAEFEGCLKCHTAGFGEPGGFRSEAVTPQLKNAGCESCHGPGSLHVETGESRDIKGKLTLADCEKCHSAERVDAFKFKPMIYGGAH